MARDDVDDAVDGVGAPQRRARPADDLDAIDVAEDVVLHVPEDAGEERRVDRAPVDHHQQLVGGVGVEAAWRDRPGAVVEARDVDAVGEEQRVGDRRHAGAADVVAA